MDERRLSSRSPPSAKKETPLNNSSLPGAPHRLHWAKYGMSPIIPWGSPVSCSGVVQPRNTRRATELHESGDGGGRMRDHAALDLQNTTSKHDGSISPER